MIKKYVIGERISKEGVIISTILNLKTGSVYPNCMAFKSKQ